MATFDDIDPGLPISFRAVRMGTAPEGIAALLNDVLGIKEVIEGIPEVAPVTVTGQEVPRFLNVVIRNGFWRVRFERDLQCISEDTILNRPVLTTWLRISEFHDFCAARWKDQWMRDLSNVLRPLACAKALHSIEFEAYGRITERNETSHNH